MFISKMKTTNFCTKKLILLFWWQILQWHCQKIFRLSIVAP